MRPFVPLARNPHFLTIAASFWPRRLEEWRYRVEAKLYPTGNDVRVLVLTQRPAAAARGEVVLVHGMEGSSHSGYMRSMAQTLLDAGFVVHRFNVRSCGGTEFLCPTLYHGGLTSDLFAFLMELDRQRRAPVWLVGFSLGGNMVLKLAGELGGSAHRLLRGVAAASAPIDLAACSRRIGAPSNRIYQWWFLRSMKRRLRLRQRVLPDSVTSVRLKQLRTLWEMDDRVTAPAFGFQGAAHYYSTQSAAGFLPSIRVPALLVQAKDDPLIPFEMFEQEALAANPHIRLLSTDHGGHLGFLARRRPVFWLDATIRDWLMEMGNK